MGARSRAHRGRRFRRIGALAIVTVLPFVANACVPVVANDAPIPDDAAVLSLREEGDRAGILIGSGAINPDYLDDPRFAATLAEQFNSLSPENELKFSRSEPQHGVFNFAPLDRLVDFAQAHDMAVKGHGLISGGVNPSWLTRSTNTPDFVRAATFNHFNTLMDRYHGRVDRWDVATEVLSTFGGTGLQHNFWYNTLGPDYLAEVFQMAHRADPSARLFLNESLVEYYPAKAQELYDLVADLVARGVPIHGVGLESHATIVGPNPGTMTEIIDSYQALGLEVAVTELDVHVTDETAGAGQADTVQAQIYGDMVSEALAAGVTDISFWGFTDAHIYTWLPGARPSMFDESYNPKPAYFATWTALANHVFASPQEALGSVREDVHTLVDAGALDASHARALTNKLDFAVRQLDRHNTTSAAAKVQSATRLAQHLVNRGDLSTRDGQDLIYKLSWVLSTLS